MISRFFQIIQTTGGAPAGSTVLTAGAEDALDHFGGASRPHRWKRETRFILMFFGVALLLLVITALMFQDSTPKQPDKIGLGHSKPSSLDLFP